MLTWDLLNLTLCNRWLLTWSLNSRLSLNLCHVIGPICVEIQPDSTNIKNDPRTVVWEKCNSISFYLLYLFKQHLNWIIHQSFESTAPTYGDSRGIAGVRCWTITFWLSPLCRRSVGVITLGHLPCWDFLLSRVGQRAGLLPSACPHRAGLIPGLWKLKNIIPAHPPRWGSSGYKWPVHKWHL